MLDFFTQLSTIQTQHYPTNDFRPREDHSLLWSHYWATNLRLQQNKLVDLVAASRLDKSHSGRKTMP